MARIDVLNLIKPEGPYKGSVKRRRIDDLLFAMHYGTDERACVALRLEVIEV